MWWISIRMRQHTFLKSAKQKLLKLHKNHWICEYTPFLLSYPPIEVVLAKMSTKWRSESKNNDSPWLNWSFQPNTLLKIYFTMIIQCIIANPRSRFYFNRTGSFLICIRITKFNDHPREIKLFERIIRIIKINRLPPSDRLAYFKILSNLG